MEFLSLPEDTSQHVTALRAWMESNPDAINTPMDKWEYTPVHQIVHFGSSNLVREILPMADDTKVTIYKDHLLHLAANRFWDSENDLESNLEIFDLILRRNLRWFITFNEVGETPDLILSEWLPLILNRYPWLAQLQKSNMPECRQVPLIQRILTINVSIECMITILQFTNFWNFDFDLGNAEELPSTAAFLRYFPNHHPETRIKILTAASILPIENAIETNCESLEEEIIQFRAQIYFQLSLTQRLIWTLQIPEWRAEFPTAFSETSS